jgi:hypothetical protein
MSILLPTLFAGFAGACIWLGVRYFNRRDRWAKWTLVLVLSLPTLYVASFGPACWITSRLDYGTSLVPIVYRPLIRRFSLKRLDPRPTTFRGFLVWYSAMGAAPDWGWGVEFPETPGPLIWHWKRIATAD